MSSEFFRITDKDLQSVKSGECWSIENMTGHGAEGSKLEYIGGRITDQNRVYNYFVDENGRYWYRMEMRLNNGKIIPMEEYLFPNKYKKRHRQ